MNTCLSQKDENLELNNQGKCVNFADAEALTERLITTNREVVFLVGAPLTAPVRGAHLGVPDVRGMVSLIVDFLRKTPSRAVEKLNDSLKNTTNPYQLAFKHLSDYRGTDAANAIIRHAVLQSRQPSARTASNENLNAEQCESLENDLDGWYYTPAVDTLGQIVARFPTRFGRSLLTTNFDPLIELSIRRAAGRAFSKILAGDSSLEDVLGGGNCVVVHLHGYWYGADTLHTPLSLNQARPLLLASLKRLLRRSTVVVIAYSGWDDIFTRALTETSIDPGENPDVLWCFYDQDRDVILRSKAQLLAQLQPAISRHRVTFISGIDCHDFLPRLLARLNQETGESAKGLAPLVRELKRDDTEYIARPQIQDTLLDAFERRQPVQLIGPKKMGKSTLLHWMERTVHALNVPVAFVNARGMEGRSPVDLVLAIGRSLNRGPEVRKALHEESAIPDTRAAEKAIQQLAPLCLLVDEADALADKDHGFDKGFFDTLRVLGQEGKLVWVSASEENLFDIYSGTGLTSAFLNDARPLRVGALSKSEAEQWLHARRVDVSNIGFGVESAGGFPYTLEWMSNRLAQPLVDRAGVEQGFKQWAYPLFSLWWQSLSPVERVLLQRCSGDGLPLGDLESANRRKVRSLVNDGFLIEDEDRFKILGQAWRDFVRDADPHV